MRVRQLPNVLRLTCKAFANSLSVLTFSTKFSRFSTALEEIMSICVIYLIFYTKRVNYHYLFNQDFSTMEKVTKNLDRELYQKVRGAFIIQNSSLHRWTTENQVSFHQARDVLQGRYNGPKARALRKRILDAVNLKEDSQT